MTDITIQPPNFATATIFIEGTSPLVIQRFSKKAERMMDMAEGERAKNKRRKEARDYEAEFEAAKHIAEDGWEGFHAAAIRNALISACRVVGFAMTKARLSVFSEADGFDRDEGTPLIRIYGEPELHSATTFNSGPGRKSDVRVRPMYRRWASVLHITFDQDQFSASDVVNLLSRAGIQVGIGEGRPDSKSSNGMGWGTFRVINTEEQPSIAARYGIEEV